MKVLKDDVLLEKNISWSCCFSLI